MARVVKVEVVCSRCARVEHQEGDPDPIVFKANINQGAKEILNIRFDDLCTPCTALIIKMLEQVGKSPKGVSRVRNKKAEEPTPEVEAKKEEVPVKAPPPKLPR